MSPAFSVRSTPAQRLHRAEALGDAAHRDEGSALALSPLRGGASGEGGSVEAAAALAFPPP